MTSPEAGWYADPDDARSDRWWDGARWSDARRPTVSDEPSPGATTPTIEASPPMPPPGWYPDPTPAVVERYWDGTSWTTEVRISPR